MGLSSITALRYIGLGLGRAAGGCSVRDTSRCVTHHTSRGRAQLLWCTYISRDPCFAPSNNSDSDSEDNVKFFQYDSTFGRESNGQYSHELTGFRSNMVNLGQFWSIWSISLPLPSTPAGFIVLYWRWSKMIFIMVKTVTLLLETEWAMSRLWQFTWLHNCFPPSVLIPHPRSLDTRTLKCVLCDRSLDYRRVNLLLKIRWQPD